MYFKLVFVAVLAVTVLAKPKVKLEPKLQAIADDLHNKCNAKFPIENKFIEDALDGHFTEDQNFKCYMHCTFDQFGLLDQEGGIKWESFDEALELVPSERRPLYIKMKEDCKPIESTTKGKDPCQRIYEMNVCFQKANPEIYILI